MAESTKGRESVKDGPGRPSVSAERHSIALFYSITPRRRISKLVFGI